MTYGRQFGLQMMGLAGYVIDIARTVMVVATKVGHALYAVVRNTGLTGQSVVELGAPINSTH